MTARWRWLLTLVTRKLWLRVSVLALFGVATAIAGIVFAPYVPDAWAFKIGADAIDGILNVLASSLLSVTVFSATTMVAAYGAATENVTPRATTLLMQDRTSQNVLGTFVGAFLFSLVGIVALSTGLYGSHGRAIMLVMTVALIALIAVTILRWIDYLARFGRLGETVQRVEEATWTAMRIRRCHPYLGGRPMLDEPPSDAVRVFAPAVGYVQHIDMAALQHCAEQAKCHIYVEALPGAFADPSKPLAFVTAEVAPQLAQAISAAFTVAVERTFDQDPRFGLCVLAEIAARALSPSVNDPGTAIDVIGRGVRLLTQWAQVDPQAVTLTIDHTRVHVPAIRPDDMLEDLFAPIERDGAGVIEIQVRLQKAFAALRAIDIREFGPSAQYRSRLALTRAEAALMLDTEREQVGELAAVVQAGAA
jgi:uncharacterized membrane protein